MARKDTRGFANDIGKDLRSQVEVQYNQLIQETINDLTFGKVNGRRISPVLTGFFSSSWKASTGSIAETDKRADYPRWAKIKTTVINGRTVLASGQQSYSKVRHYIPKNFKIRDTVRIGNTAEYTPYALQSPKRNIIPYLLGAEGLNAKINRIFRDRKPNAIVGGRSDFSSGADFGNMETVYENPPVNFP